MFDKLLEIGSVFDWISPLTAGIKDAVNGPSHTFLVPNNCGRSGIEIERLLRRHGIKTWGLMMVGDTTMITVPKHQASWGQYLLRRDGIPICGPLVEGGKSSPMSPGRRQGSTQSVIGTKQPESSSNGLLGMMAHMLDELAGAIDKILP